MVWWYATFMGTGPRFPTYSLIRITNIFYTWHFICNYINIPFGTIPSCGGLHPCTPQPFISCPPCRNIHQTFLLKSLPYEPNPTKANFPCKSASFGRHLLFSRKLDKDRNRGQVSKLKNMGSEAWGAHVNLSWNYWLIGNYGWWL